MREWRNYSECNVEGELYPATSKPVWSVPLTHALAYLCLCVFLHLHHLNCGCCSVAQSCLILCNPMDCSMPGLPVPHHFPEFAQVHVHCIGDAVQPSHPLMPSSSALDLSQHQGLFQWVICSNQMTKILELQHQSFQWIFRADLPQLAGLTSVLSKGLSGVSSNTTAWRHWFFRVVLSLSSSSHNHTWSLGRP